MQARAWHQKRNCGPLQQLNLRGPRLAVLMPSACLHVNVNPPHQNRIKIRCCKGLTDAAARGDTTAQSLLAQVGFVLHLLGT